MSSEMIRFALLILAASIAVGPILLKRNFRFRTRVDAKEVLLADLPENVRAFMTATLAELAPLGFGAYDCFDVTGRQAGVTSFITVAVNRASRERANLYFACASGVERGFVEFLACTSNGRSVETNTNGAPTPMFPRPYFVYRFPQVDDASLLYRLHRHFVRQHLGDAALVLPAEGEEGADISRRLGDYVTYHERRGLLKREPDGEYTRLTWRGALVMSWRGLWPVALWRRVKMFRDADARLAGYG